MEIALSRMLQRQLCKSDLSGMLELMTTASIEPSAANSSHPTGIKPKLVI